MLALAFAFVLVAAPDMELCTDKIADAMNSQSCKGLGAAIFVDDINGFLAGVPSMLGTVFQHLDKEGRLTELLDHIARARAYWRRGQPTPRASGH